MRISKSSLAAIFFTALASRASAQVLSPAEISDPAIRDLQKTHLAELHAIPAALANHQFPYRFYFSRALDLTERDQAGSDQRSIQFDRFQGRIVLKITGNYFAAYSAARMTKQERARQTYLDVMLPILRAAAPAFAKASVPDAFALEISHHVVGTVLGVDTESAENVVLVLPKASAQRLMDAPDEAAGEAAVLEGSAYLNGSPISFWPGEGREPPALQASAAPTPAAAPPASARTAPTPAAAPPASIPLAPPAAAAPPPPADAPATLDANYRATLAKMVDQLDSQAHFLAYAPPSFIAFHGGRYLQLPISTALAPSDSGSQYKLAALAFDRHVAHLIRPVLAYFKDDATFTGIDFSTTVHLTGPSAAGEGAEAVEFIFPLAALRSYREFDLTGQQLLDAGFVLINGERVSLGLQAAEAVGAPPD